MNAMLLITALIALALAALFALTVCKKLGNDPVLLVMITALLAMVAWAAWRVWSAWANYLIV